jgi:hypothetical protein
VSDERHYIYTAASAILVGFFANITLVLWKGQVQLGLTMFATSVAVAALLLTAGRRMSELDGEKRRARQEAEVVRLLESIDHRLTPSPVDDSQGDEKSEHTASSRPPALRAMPHTQRVGGVVRHPETWAAHNSGC